MELVKLYFDEVAHKYTDEHKRQYVSTTTFLQDYYTHFNTKEKARQCYIAGTKGNLKYKGKSQRQIELEWDLAKKMGCDQGNVKHNYLEDIVKASTNFRTASTKYVDSRIYTIPDIIVDPGYGELKVDYFTQQGLQSKYPMIYEVIVYLASKGYRFYAEVGVFNAEYLISGLIDLIAIKDKEFIIIDWKTNKADLLYTAGYHEKDRAGMLTGKFIENYETMLRPITHLPASQGIKYSLQLSMYARLTEFFGLTCHSLMLFHIITDQYTKEERVIFHPIRYFKQDIDLLLMDRSTRMPKIGQVEMVQLM